MAQVINLNRARKAKAKADARTVAAANRAAFGRTGAQRATEETERRRAEQRLDGSKLEE